MSKNMKTIQPVIDNGTLTRGVSESISTTPIKEIKKKLDQAAKGKEKKKRLPKPQKSVSLEYLFLYGLPFLNAKDEEEIISSAQSFIKPLVKDLPFTGLSPVSLVGWTEGYSKEFFSFSITRKNLVEAQRVARLLVKTSCLSFSFQPVDQEINYQNLMEPLEPVYNRFYSKGNLIIPNFKIGVRDQNNAIENQNAFNRTWSKGLPAIIICFVLSALSDGAYPVEEKGITPKGFSFIHSYMKSAAIAFLGMCPRCEKIFEKKQWNTKYCGKSCANMDSRDKMKKK